MRPLFVPPKKAPVWRLLRGLALLMMSGRLMAQSASGITLLTQEQISKADPKSPHYESHLAIDPREPKHMIAMATVQWATVALDSEHRWVHKGSNVFVTFDGGNHWDPSKLADPALKSGGDGTVYLTRDGIAFMVVGVAVKGQAKTVIGRSVDGGRTFRQVAALPYRDRPWLSFDTSGGVFDGAIYLVGQLNGMVVSRSTDGGLTWSFADHIRRDEGGPIPDAPVAGITGDMLVTPDGDVIVTYKVGHVDEARATVSRSDSVLTGRLDLLISNDGTRTWRGVRHGPLIHDVKDYRRDQTLQAVRSAIDQSRGKWRNRLYAVWPEYDETLDRYVVQSARTDDVGKSWTTTTVSDSSMRGPTSNISVAVNKDGVVAVTWYDRRDDPRGLCWRLYAAISLDGGQHFEQNQKLSDAATCTNVPTNWLLSAWPEFDTWTDSTQPRPSFALTAFVPVRFPNGGETLGLAADRDGLFHVAWINGVTGVMQLWHTSFLIDKDVLIKAQSTTVATASSRDTDGRSENLSLELKFEVSSPHIDFARGTLEVTMRVVNPTSHTVRAPLSVVLEKLLLPRAQGMGLKELRVANADNGRGDAGAMWSFNAPDGSALGPKEMTDPRTLRFTFDPGTPEKPKGYFTPRFAIYEARKTP